MSILQEWLSATDKPGTAIRSVLFDFRKTFDLIDHNILVNEVVSLDLSTPTKNWILDLIDRNCVTLRNGAVRMERYLCGSSSRN